MAYYLRTEPSFEDILSAESHLVREYLRDYEYRTDTWQRVLQQLPKFFHPYNWLPDTNWSGQPMYIECIDIWSNLIDEGGLLTATGLAVALGDSQNGKRLERYLADKYQTTEADAFEISSNAMFDLMTVRNLPTTGKHNYD